MANKDLSINVHENIKVASLVCSIKIVTVPKILLQQARYFLDSKEPGLYKLCVILSHMALEIEVSRVESAYLKKKGFVDDDIEPLLYQKTNIAGGNKRAIQIFKAITRQEITDSIDLVNLKKMNDRRNKIVHRGEEATEEEAREAVDCVEKAIDALEVILRAADAIQTKKP